MSNLDTTGKTLIYILYDNPQHYIKDDNGEIPYHLLLWAFVHYVLRRLTTKSRELSRPRDWMF